MNGSSVLESLDELVARARNEIVQLEEEKAAIDERLERLYKLLGLSQPEPPKKRYLKTGLQNTIRIGEQILELSPGTRFTLNDLETPDIRVQTIREHVQKLEAEGFLVPEGKVGNSRVWRVANPSVLDRLRQELESRS